MAWIWYEIFIVPNIYVYVDYEWDKIQIQIQMILYFPYFALGFIYHIILCSYAKILKKNFKRTANGYSGK